MKSKEEIEQLGGKYATTHEDVSDKLSKYLVSACFQDGYTQCQKDIADKKYDLRDIEKAFLQGCASERRFLSIIDELDKYIISLNKQD